MRTMVVAGFAALALAGCASTTTPQAGDGDAKAAAPVQGSSGGNWAVSIVGTPFLLVFRGVVCAGSLVVAAPTSAMLALANSPEGLEILSDGIAQNCGGPYVLAPGDVS
jgi:uncharacterized protein YceK